MTSKVKPKEAVTEILQSMNVGVVRDKGVVRPITTRVGGKGKSFPVTSYVFDVEIIDDHTTYKVSFDRVHFDSFEVGERIGFEFKDKNGYFVVQKRHRICNITKTRGEVMEVRMRPREELQHLVGRCDKRFKEIAEYLKKSPQQATKIELERERKEILRLGGLIHFVLTGNFPPHKEYDPRVTYDSCTIVTRYLGEESLPQVLERAKKRFATVSSTAEGHKKSVEYTELQKLITALKWILDQAKDTHLGLYFSWNLFSRKLKDDFTLHGTERDEFLQKERRSEDIHHLRDEAAKVLEEQHNLETEKRLTEKFSFIAKKGGFPREKKKKP